MEAAKAALSSDAGRALLERMARLERIEAAARKLEQAVKAFEDANCEHYSEEMNDLRVNIYGAADDLRLALSPPPARGEGQGVATDKKGDTNG